MLTTDRLRLAKAWMSRGLARVAFSHGRSKATARFFFDIKLWPSVMPSFGRQASCAYASAASASEGSSTAFAGKLIDSARPSRRNRHPRAAFGTAQQPRPVRYGHSGAVLRDAWPLPGRGMRSVPAVTAAKKRTPPPAGLRFSKNPRLSRRSSAGNTDPSNSAVHNRSVRVDSKPPAGNTRSRNHTDSHTPPRRQHCQARKHPGRGRLQHRC